MSEIENAIRRWQLPKPSTNQLLAGALTLSLLFSGFLLIRANNRPPAVAPAPSADSVPALPALAATTGTVTTATPDINAIAAQLQETQRRLQDVTAQLERKGQLSGYAAAGGAAPAPGVVNELPVLLAEIDQLYQVMQPLMVQVEAATASQSSRSTSELIALRTRVNTIHQRLAYLLDRVETVKAHSRTGAGSGMMHWPAPTQAAVYPTVPDQVMVDQLYQNMIRLQDMLYQLERQGATP